MLSLSQLVREAKVTHYAMYDRRGCFERRAMSSAVHLTAAAGEVYLPKGFDWDRSIPVSEREAILERILLLPAWADHQLGAANLDVKRVEGQSEMLLPISGGGTRAAKDEPKKSVKVARSTARSRKAAR